MAHAFRRAARLVVVYSRNRVLLLQNARITGQKFWAAPGGGLEYGETLDEAAAREALVRSLGLETLLSMRCAIGLGPGVLDVSLTSWLEQDPSPSSSRES